MTFLIIPIEAGKLQLDVHPVELEPLMRDLAVVLAGNQARKEVEVMFDLDSNLPNDLIGDSLRLQQVLINLAVMFRSPWKARSWSALNN